MNLIRFTILVMVVAASTSSLQRVRASIIGMELVTNGDAETASLVGWVNDEMQIVTTVAVEDNGDPPPAGIDVGDYSFTGGGGTSPQSMMQTIDVSSLATEIDGGMITSLFSGLVQSRRVVGGSDIGTAKIEYLNNVGVVIGSASFTDLPPVADHQDNGEFDWMEFEDTRIVATGTREMRISLIAMRDGGGSTDAYFDNVSLSLSGDVVPEPSSIITLAGLLASFSLFGWWKKRRQAA